MEHFFTCPYCWERISMILDYSEEESSYIEEVHAMFKASFHEDVSTINILESLIYITLKSCS